MFRYLLDSYCYREVLVMCCFLCCCVLFFFLMIRRPPGSTRTDTLFPYTTLFRSSFSVIDFSMLFDAPLRSLLSVSPRLAERAAPAAFCCAFDFAGMSASFGEPEGEDRKSTRLNSSH